MHGFFVQRQTGQRMSLSQQYSRQSCTLQFPGFLSWVQAGKSKNPPVCSKNKSTCEPYDTSSNSHSPGSFASFSFLPGGFWSARSVHSCSVLDQSRISAFDDTLFLCAKRLRIYNRYCEIVGIHGFANMTIMRSRLSHPLTIYIHSYDLVTLHLHCSHPVCQN